jgi:inhibitor of cysteine peptidase
MRRFFTMKKIVVLTLVGLLIVAASGFNWVWKSFDDSGNYRFEFSGDNPVSIINPAGNAPDTLEVQAGDTFSLTLDSNPTTGYQWELAEALDESVLRLMGQVYTPSGTNLAGAGGKENWTFYAAGKGTTEISLKYTRPWEEDAPPAVTRQFTVIVSGGSGTIIIPVTPVPSADIVTVVGATVTFSISQPVVPGGEWNIVELDESVLTLINDETVSQEGVLGAVVRVLTFRAVGAGYTTVHLENASNRSSFTALILE